MDNESHNNHDNSNNIPSDRDKSGGGNGSGSLLLRASSSGIGQSATSDLVLKWGNRKRLRCMKVQVKHYYSNAVQRTTVRVDRRVVRTEKDSSNRPIVTDYDNNNNNNHSQSKGYQNLRQHPLSPQQPARRILRICVEVVDSCLPRNFVREQRQHVLADVSSKLKRRSRNSETSSAMRGGQNNGSVRGITSPDRGAHDKRGTHNNHLNNNNNKPVGSTDTAHDSKKGCGSPSGSGDAAPPVWPPKFVIALTNKEKEEDFLAIKGSKLPQRPKKRAKFIQRTLNLVSPGTWLCDLTLERYEVREKKISKKRPRGLKAMGNMDSDSE